MNLNQTLDLSVNFNSSLHMIILRDFFTEPASSAVESKWNPREKRM
jgi:hypothetical protein